MKPFIFIDGNHLFFRSYYILGKKLGIGSHLGASNSICYGFINTFMSLMQMFDGEKLIVCFDSPPYFRHEIYKDYKGSRVPKEDPYIAAMALCKDMLGRIGFIQLSIDGLEADDLAGIFSHLLSEKGKKCLIVTDDKDYYQLLRKNVKLYRPGPKEVYTTHNFKIDYKGFKPKDIIMIKAIAGDRGDNIIGISGVGEKTAIKILTKYKKVKDIIKNKKEIKAIRGCKNVFEKGNMDRVRLNKTLVRIPNSQKDIDRFIEQDYITKKQIKRAMKSFESDLAIKKTTLSRIFRRFGLRKFRNELIKGEKDMGKLLGLEIK